ncbi:MAG: DNA repair protein RecO [Alphaproteobacteria bacterium]|nr:DNA repair protein RecO [Alphaproteobacteria bacterium]
MEQWQDQSIILAARTHGENGAIVSLLSRSYGRQSGYVRGASSTKNRGTLEIGNIVDANWRARTSDSLGYLTLELSHSTASRIMQDALKLSALQAACALCDQALPEKEGHEGLYNGLCALLEILEGDVWAHGYVMWEIALLKELGFALDLTRCAAGGDVSMLSYVSPKTGCAVSWEAAQPYKDKLLPLPEFLKPHGQESDEGDILLGLKLTRYFFEHWVFAHHNRGLPEARHRLDLRFAEVSAKTDKLIRENT